MGSISIKALRSEYPGKSDAEIATKLAEGEGYVTVLRYKSRGSPDYTDFATCILNEQVEGYFNSTSCSDVEILYDIRSCALKITTTLLLQSKCRSCARPATQQSLVISGGNDFYFCPVCATMFCSNCSLHLPLDNYPTGYAKCADCGVKLQRAFPGAIGNKPLKAMTTEKRNTFIAIFMFKSLEEAKTKFSNMFRLFSYAIEGKAEIIQDKDTAILKFRTKEITTRDYEAIREELRSKYIY